MEIKGEKIQKVIQWYDKNGASQTIEELVDLFGIVAREEDMNDKGRKEFLNAVEEQYDNLYQTEYELSQKDNATTFRQMTTDHQMRQKKILEWVSIGIMTLCERAIEEVRQGEQEILRLFSVFSTLSEEEIKATPFETLIEYIGKEKSNWLEGEVSEEAQRTILQLFYDHEKNDNEKKEIAGSLCENLSEDALNAIYAILQTLRKVVSRWDKEKHQLLDTFMSIALNYLPDVDEDMEWLIDAFLAEIESLSLREDKKWQLIFLFSFLASQPKVEEYLTKWLSHILYAQTVETLLSLCEKENYKALWDTMGRERLFPKARVERCLDDIKESYLAHVIREKASYKTQNIIDLLERLKNIVATTTSKKLLKASSTVKERFAALMLPEDYTWMLKPPSKEVKWISYLLAALDLIESDQSYYTLAQKLRWSIVEGLEMHGLSYRVIQDKQWYIVRKGSIPPDIIVSTEKEEIHIPIWQEAEKELLKSQTFTIRGEKDI